MALLFNGNRLLGDNRCRFNGVASNTYADKTVRQNIFTGTTADKKSGIPSGTSITSAILLPILQGGMSSFTLLRAGSAITTANAQAGANMVANLSASFVLTNADLGLIVNMVANLSASGSFTTAQLGAIANLAANLSASGAITSAQLGAIVDISASLSASGSLTAFCTSLANMQATIGGATPLSPEGLAQAVWNYLKENPTATGSMKEVLEKAKQSADNAFAVSS